MHIQIIGGTLGPVIRTLIVARMEEEADIGMDWEGMFNGLNLNVNWHG
ncbi:MAG: hypothetical protein U5L00_21085 [Desulfovermiculus sp.]|nr:hypothetical protein [Desulfovermiculus sp.]